MSTKTLSFCIFFALGAAKAVEVHETCVSGGVCAKDGTASTSQLSAEAPFSDTIGLVQSKIGLSATTRSVQNPSDTEGMTQESSLCVCTTEYSPVCYQGVTFSNQCQLACFLKGQVVSCGGSIGSIPLVQPGNTSCPEEYKPICFELQDADAREKLNFGNRCRMLEYFSGVVKNGECPIGPKPCACTKEIDPVCYKETTFNNVCELECHIKGKVQKGQECSKDPCSTMDNPFCLFPVVCPTIWDPQCFEGMLFDNTCLLRAYVKNDVQTGTCPKK